MTKNKNAAMNREKLLDDLKMELRRRAEERFPDQPIGPCGNKNSLSECFTIDKMPRYNIIMLWYNVGRFTYVESVTFDHLTEKEFQKIGGKDVEGTKQGNS